MYAARRKSIFSADVICLSSLLFFDLVGAAVRVDVIKQLAAKAYVVCHWMVTVN